MKKIKYILICVVLMIILVLIPNVIHASNDLDSDKQALSLNSAIGIEIFCSIHMSIFFLLPLSKLISKNNYKKTFLVLFIIRAAILLVFDLYITTNIAIIDFFLIFIGAFIITPILSTIKNGKTAINSSTTNNVQGITNIENNEDKSPIVLVDEKYMNDEKIILKNIIKEEIEKQGENAKKLITKKLSIKKNILNIIFGLLTFIFVTMYFFNISIKNCIIAEVFNLIIYIIANKKINIINLIFKEAKKNPNEEISKIITNIINNKKELIIPNYLKFGIIVIVAIIIPICIFAKSKIIYLRYGDAYMVAKYTRGLNKQEEEVIIPEIYNGKNVIAIGASAFENTNIHKIKLPDKLESIKTKAFYNCSYLKSIIVPEKVTEIRASAFENCTSLITVSLPKGIKQIRGSAFKNDVKLSNVELPDSLEYLGASAFSHCSALQEITIPKNVIEINGQTFEYCTSLRKINLHDNIVLIHGENFVGDIKLDNVILPSKITQIKGNTFEDCKSLKSITIPEGVTRIGGHAFYGCTTLKSVSIPSTVNEIGSSAFRKCKALYKISIPKNAVINEKAFKESPTAITYF